MPSSSKIINLGPSLMRLKLRQYEIAPYLHKGYSVSHSSISQWSQSHSHRMSIETSLDCLLFSNDIILCTHPPRIKIAFLSELYIQCT